MKRGEGRAPTQGEKVAFLARLALLRMQVEEIELSRRAEEESMGDIYDEVFEEGVPRE